MGVVVVCYGTNEAAAPQKILISVSNFVNNILTAGF